MKIPSDSTVTLALIIGIIDEAAKGLGKLAGKSPRSELTRSFQASEAALSALVDQFSSPEFWEQMQEGLGEIVDVKEVAEFDLSQSINLLAGKAEK